MGIEIARVLVGPRVQGLPRQLQVPGDLPVVAERDVVVLPITDPISQLVRLRDALLAKFGFAEVGLSPPERCVSHGERRVDLDGALEQGDSFW